MCKTLKAGPVAPNNLDKMIRRSGLKNNMVAELKGIQPATLSRHKSGDIGISLGDAEEYAKILNCTAQQIFFSSPPIPVLAAVFTWNDCVTKIITAWTRCVSIGTCLTILITHQLGNTATWTLLTLTQCSEIS
jgi:hypothetical protein